MPPEDNPADDVQPTKEEWDSYERKAAMVLCSECAQTVPYDAACQDCGERSGEHSNRLAPLCQCGSMLEFDGGDSGGMFQPSTPAMWYCPSCGLDYGTVKV